MCAGSTIVRSLNWAKKSKVKLETGTHTIDSHKTILYVWEWMKREQKKNTHW